MRDWFGQERPALEADEMPHSVEGMISVRIDALEPADRQVLRMVSVIGERFAPPTKFSLMPSKKVKSSRHYLNTINTTLENYIIPEREKC